MPFVPLPVFSPEYASFAGMITHSHKIPQDYENLRFMIEHSTLDHGERAMLLSQLQIKFAN